MVEFKQENTINFKKKKIHKMDKVSDSQEEAQCPAFITQLNKI